MHLSNNVQFQLLPARTIVRAVEQFFSSAFLINQAFYGTFILPFLDNAASLSYALSCFRALGRSAPMPLIDHKIEAKIYAGQLALA